MEIHNSMSIFQKQIGESKTKSGGLTLKCQSKVINWEIIFTNSAEITKYSYGKHKLNKELK